MQCSLSYRDFRLLPVVLILAKLDMRSGIERLTYALIVILVATMSAWIMALILHLKPVEFYKTFTVNRAVDLIQASCKFLRSVWILYHV